MLQKVLKFQIVTKEEKINSIQPQIPIIDFNISSGTYRYNCQKRNQIKSIRRSKDIDYTQMVDNYKNVGRQTQENPFSEELQIKQFNNIRYKEQFTERQSSVLIDYQDNNQEYKIQVLAQKDIMYQERQENYSFITLKQQILMY